jgi:hypothetical protein
VRVAQMLRLSRSDGSVLIVALTVALIAAAAAVVGQISRAQAASFGSSTVGAFSDTFAFERKRVSRFPLAEAGW